MKTIILNVNNTAKIQNEIDTVQKLSKVRLLNIEDLNNIVIKVESKLKSLLLSNKKNWEGIEVFIDTSAQTFPQAYKYIAESTQIRLIFKNGKWEILEIWRGRTEKEFFYIQLSELAQNIIIEKIKYDIF